MAFHLSTTGFLGSARATTSTWPILLVFPWLLLSKWSTCFPLWVVSCACTGKHDHNCTITNRIIEFPSLSICWRGWPLTLLASLCSKIMFSLFVILIQINNFSRWSRWNVHHCCTCVTRWSSEGIVSWEQDVQSGIALLLRWWRSRCGLWLGIKVIKESTDNDPKVNGQDAQTDWKQGEQNQASVALHGEADNGFVICLVNANDWGQKVGGNDQKLWVQGCVITVSNFPANKGPHLVQEPRQ